MDLNDVTAKAAANVSEAGQKHLYPPPADLAANAHVKSLDEYKAMYDQSINDPETFFGNMARQFHWEKPFDSVGPIYNFDMSKGPIKIDWFQGGTTNICYNALDRHVAAGAGDCVAILWEGNSPDEQASYTYHDVLDEVKKFANVLKSKGVKKGDTVTLYMPMVVELAFACLACARIGAVHSVVFGGFSPEAIRGRMADAQRKVVVTCDAVMRGAKPVQLKTQIDAALELGKDDFTVESVVVYKRLAGECPMVDGRDTWWHDEMDKVTADCDCEWVESEHPLFMLYTSGSTGKPKGIVHTTAGYMLGAWSTFKYTFDYKPGEVYWCTADIGWITGHSYIVYGPLLERATTVMFEVRVFYVLSDCLPVLTLCFITGCAHVPRRRPMLGHLREAQGEPVLHRADRGEGAHESGRRLRDQARQVVVAHPRQRWRAHQPRGLALVLLRRRRGAMPHRGHVLADGDGFFHDHAAARRDAVEARQRHASVLRRPAGGARRQRERARGRSFWVSGHQETVAVGVEVVLRRPREVRVRVLLHVQGVLRRRRRVQKRRGWVLLDHRPRRRRHQRLRTPHGNSGGRVRSRAPPRVLRGGGRRHAFDVNIIFDGEGNAPKRLSIGIEGADLLNRMG